MGDNAQNFSVDLDSAPSELASVYSSAIAKGMQKGMSASDADKFATVQLNLAGWFQTAENGWSKLHDDVREKVNLRQAQRQPDGTYVITDIDVFYPNQVQGRISQKGELEPIKFTASDILERISNTNSAISAGGQPPGITRGHPKGDSPLPSIGSAVNWRESSRRPGQAAVDCIGVSPDVFEEWKNRKWNGLSAGLTKHADGENKRFTHVALLGSSPQALSHLPQAVVFASDEILTFSADPTDFETPQPPEKGPKMKTVLPSAAISAIAVALQNFEAGIDPKGAKLAETFASFSEVEFEAGTGQGPYEKTRVPEEPKLKPDTMTKNEDALGDGETEKKEPTMDYSVEFAAMQKKLEAVEAENTRLNRAVNGLTGIKVKADFSAFLKEQEQAGHQFDFESTMETFEALASTNNRAGVEKLKEMVKKSPMSSQVVIGNVFSAGGNGHVNGTVTKPVNGINRMTEMGVEFSAEDEKLGAAVGLCF